MNVRVRKMICSRTGNSCSVQRNLLEDCSITDSGDIDARREAPQVAFRWPEIYKMAHGWSWMTRMSRSNFRGIEMECQDKANSCSSGNTLLKFVTSRIREILMRKERPFISSEIDKMVHG